MTTIKEPVMADEPQSECVTIMLSASEARSLDEWAARRNLANREAAARELIELGLEAGQAIRSGRGI